MKRQLLATDLDLALVTSAQTADEIAVVDMGSLFQQITQRIDVPNTLENKLKDRVSELQRTETDLQTKMKKLQSIKAGSDRTRLEKDVMAQRQTFTQKTQAFKQGRARHSNEERDKLTTRTQAVVRSVANSQGIDPVVDADAVAYNDSDIKDITIDVLKQVK